MLTCPSDDGYWEGEFTVNYNLDDEPDFDTNQLNYIDATAGNYTNHWSTAFDIDTCAG